MSLVIKSKDDAPTPTSIMDPSMVFEPTEELNLELVAETDPILKQECIPFDFKNPQVSPEILFNAMKKKFIECRGLGLAAPQVGLPYKMFVIGVHDDPDNIIGVFNPVITSATDQQETVVEGCLSFPDLYMKVKRPYAIRVRYTTWEGVTDTIKFEGMTATIFQHEYSHLHGITFLDESSLYHRKKALKDRKLLRRQRKRTKS